MYIYTQGENKLKEKTLADIVSDRLQCNRPPAKTNPRQITDIVTGP